MPQPNPLVGDGRVSPFYHWDWRIPSRPGRLLRSEALPPELGLDGAGSQKRILYTSTDGIDRRTPAVVSGVLFVPPGAPPPGGWPLVAWAHGTVGVADICAPSWAGRSLRDTTYLRAWLAAGFAIVATDYHGLGVAGPHPYLYARPAAYALLDSIRAVQGGRFPVSRGVILVGQSQGGVAVIAAAGHAPTYAPAIQLRGVVATGAGSDRVAPGTMPKNDPNAVTPLMGYLPLAVMTAQITRPDVRAETLLTPRAVGMMRQAQHSCFPALVSDAMGAGLTLSNSLQPDAVAAIGAINNPHIGYSTYRLGAPLFIGSGELDKDVPLPMHAALAREACAAGTTVEWHVYKGLDHSQTVNRSLAHSLPFARRAFSGRPAEQRCTTLPE